MALFDSILPEATVETLTGMYNEKYTESIDKLIDLNIDPVVIERADSSLRMSMRISDLSSCVTLF